MIEIQPIQKLPNFNDSQLSSMNLTSWLKKKNSLKSLETLPRKVSFFDLFIISSEPIQITLTVHAQKTQSIFQLCSEQTALIFYCDIKMS